MDVRPQDLIDATDRDKFDVTAELCRIHGGEYRQVGELRKPFIANVRWLAGYRQPDWLDVTPAIWVPA
jgi:hypothetical protein